MSKKALMSKGFEPQLVRFYKAANMQIFGKYPYIPVKCIDRFKKFEAELNKAGISPKDYAYTVVRILVNWVRGKNMHYVPVNTFLGQWALSRYNKIVNSETVTIAVDEDEHDRMLHTELMVARQYIYENSKQCKRMTEVVEDLRPLLYTGWLQAYNNGWPRPVQEVLDILCKEYGIQARSYADIVTWQTHTVTH